MRTHPLVLIAEDDPAAREALTVRLAQSGFDVVPAANGQQAVKLVDENIIDAAILDVKMPGMDGFGVCEYIREKEMHIPVFFLTGAADGVVRNFLGKLTASVGGDHYVTKPYDGKVLAMMLRDAIQRAPGASG